MESFFKFASAKGAAKGAEMLAAATGERWHYKKDPDQPRQWLAYKVERVMVKSLMSGQMVEIDSDTPLCCNPASETYWSM